MQIKLLLFKIHLKCKMNLQKIEMWYLQAYYYLPCTAMKKWSSHAPIYSFPLSTTTMGATIPLCTYLCDRLPLLHS